MNILPRKEVSTEPGAIQSPRSTLDLPLEQQHSGVKVLKRQMNGRANPDLPPPPRSFRRQAEREITQILGMLPLPLGTLPRQEHAPVVPGCGYLVSD
jgi:hypothetical protein